MAGIDINRTTAGVRLDPVVSAEIWSAAEYASAAMQLADQVPLPGAGVTIDVITGEPVAEWVAETASKPISRPTLASKLLTPYTLAVIVPFSNQFRRDKAGLYNELVRKLPQALAKKFDETVFGAVPAPGPNFDKLSAAPNLPVGGADTYKALVAAVGLVAASGGILNGWALSPQGAGLVLGAVDGVGRPLFVPNTDSGAVPSILGAPVYVSKGVFVAGTPNTVGFGGDWAGAAWGSVEGVTVSIATEATLDDGGTPLNLWQRNMFAVRAEIEIGFRVRDVTQFVELTDNTFVPPASDESAASRRSTSK